MSTNRRASIPEIIAHRGASRECRENTLAAFARALEQEADGIELDVHATSDGVVVVHHDFALPLTPGGVLRPIAELLWTDLRSVELPGGEHVPTLDEVCALVGTRATLYVEVKGLGIEQPVADVLARFPQLRAAVHAFDHRIPVEVRRLRPATPIGLLSASYPLDVAAWVGAVRPDAFWQQAQLIDAALVDAVHGMGSRLIAWTENDGPHARQLAAWGVDALCTDTPGALRAAF
jgi:glycerophosphoryl diester phosphodiesterase